MHQQLNIVLGMNFSVDVLRRQRVVLSMSHHRSKPIGRWDMC